MTNNHNTLTLGQYTLDFDVVLGKGSTGDVYRGQNPSTFERVAIKAIRMDQINNEVTHYLLQGQKQALTTIKNEYVVHTYQVKQFPDYCYIIMQYCPSGTLQQYIKKLGKLTNYQSIQIFKKILTGYISITEALFIHRDLKTSNIMLRYNNDPVIIDFGYCERIMGKRPLMHYNVGSPSYMAPQAYYKNRYSQKSDVWSLGIILYEMLTGETPDIGIESKEFFDKILKSGKVQYKTQFMSEVCVELLKAALEPIPEKRATAHKLKYIIDKSMIPQLRKAYTLTQSSLPKSPQTTKFVTKFNYGTVSNQNSQENMTSKFAFGLNEKSKETNQKSTPNLLMNRTWSNNTWSSQKNIPTTPTKINKQALSNEGNQNSLNKNHQSQFAISSLNPPRQHQILTKPTNIWNSNDNSQLISNFSSSIPNFSNSNLETQLIPKNSNFNNINTYSEMRMLKKNPSLSEETNLEYNYPKKATLQKTISLQQNLSNNFIKTNSYLKF